MRIAVLVGAGATAAEAAPREPDRRTTPPLDGTFFRQCRYLKPAGLKELNAYLTNTYGINLTSQNYGMEEIFNIVYADALSGDPAHGATEACWALFQIYRQRIMDSTNPLTGNARSGVGALLRAILRVRRDPNISFVTFNHDLVIEKAIQRAFATAEFSHLEWNLFQAYEVDFKQFVRAPTPQDQLQIGSKRDLLKPIRVLKLHGSLNWGYPVRSIADAGNSIRIPPGGLYCISSATVYPVTVKKGNRTFHIVPFLVPPSYEKSARIREVLRPVWLRAGLVLQSADALIVFGYSFPDADVAARNLIRRACHGNTALKRIHIIDTNPQVATAVARLSGAKSTCYYPNVREFGRFAASALTSG